MAKASLIGLVTQGPELQHSAKGEPYVRFSVYSPSVSVCFLANRTIYGGFLHRLGRKKRKKSQPVSSLHQKPAACMNRISSSARLLIYDMLE